MGLGSILQIWSLGFFSSILNIFEFNQMKNIPNNNISTNKNS